MSSSRRSKSRRIKQLLANIFVAILGVITVLLLVGLFLPHHYLVERKVEIRAKPEAVYPFLTGLRNWPDWTVWNREMDPTVEFSYETPDTGAGAKYTWDGKKLGRGWLKLTKAEPAKGVWYELDFSGGQYLSTGSLLMSGDGNPLTVTWTNEGELGKNPVNRYFGLFMDRMVGGDFEKGLARLKAKAEDAGGPK